VEQTTTGHFRVFLVINYLNCPNVKKEYTSQLTADVGDNGMKMASVVDTVLGITNLITALRKGNDKIQMTKINYLRNAETSDTRRTPIQPGRQGEEEGVGRDGGIGHGDH
jgi:hypothetical protein